MADYDGSWATRAAVQKLFFSSGPRMFEQVDELADRLLAGRTVLPQLSLPAIANTLLNRSCDGMSLVRSRSLLK